MVDRIPYPPLPADVRRFLDRSIAAVEQLEILLLLHQQPDRSWDAGEPWPTACG